MFSKLHFRTFDFSRKNISMDFLKVYYTEYGRFIINFESICYHINFYIRNVINKDDMFKNDDRRIEILLEGITANPLLSKFKSIFLTTTDSENIDLTNIFTNFSNSFSKIIELRNYLAHGTFMFQPNTDEEIFKVINPKLTKKGFTEKGSIITIESFRKLNDNIEKLKKVIGNINYFSHAKNIENSTLKEILIKETLTILSNIDVNLDKIELK